jgi:tetratricopeptide (TPR) repeat protein
MDRSIENLSEALRMDKQFSMARAYLGLAYLGEESLEKSTTLERAENECLAAYSVDSQQQFTNFCLAEIEAEKGNLEKAFEYYQIAFHTGPLELFVLNGLIDIAYRLDRFEAMVPLLESAIQRQPDFWLGYDFLAYVYYAQGNYESAVIQQKIVVDLAPEKISGYNNLAVFYDMLGCLEQAAEAYEKALALKRESSLYTNLAVTYFYSGQYSKALKTAQEAKTYLRHEPEMSYYESGNLADIQFWVPGGDREIARDYYSEALKLVNEFLEKSPDDLEALRSRCWYLAMLNRVEDCEKCLEQILAYKNQNCETCYKLALIFQRLGRKEEALKYLKSSLSQGKLANQVRNEPILQDIPEFNQILEPFFKVDTICP